MSSKADLNYFYKRYAQEMRSGCRSTAETFAELYNKTLSSLGGPENNKGEFYLSLGKRVQIKDLDIDLPLLDQGETWINVEYKGKCLYLGLHVSGHCFISLLSDDLNKPIYKGGFMDIYPQKNKSLSETLNIYY